MIGAGQAPEAPRLTSDTFKDIQIRSLCPSYTTGRVADIALDPNNSSVYYVVAAAGGLWKSENRGNTFTPIFDSGGAFNLCCVVVDPKNSNVIWLGTGENSNPRSAMYGGGVYKTTDGGRTWKALLTVSENTGANDLVMDPNNPDVLYATTWQRRRATGQFVGGGPESRVYKTTNAGAAWSKLTNGLPKGDMGRIAIGVDPKVKPTRVYLLANALRGEAGFYRS